MALNNMRKVSFLNDGLKIVGDFYFPLNYQADKKYPAVVVTGSWTSVKEQMAGLYARELARRGFITLAFDFRHFGESEGEIRALESAQLKISDIHQAVNFLRQQPEISNGQIAGLSVCASSGYMAHAIAEGAPIKAFSTVAAWLHNPETARQIYTPAFYDQLMQEAKAARLRYQQTGDVDYVPAFSMTDQRAAMRAETPGYYGDPARGAIPAWDNRFPVMAWEEWLSFDALSPATQITMPTLMVHSDESALPDNVRQFHAKLNGPKALYWMQGQHLDFYDHPQLVEEAMDVVSVYLHRALRESTLFI